MYAKKTSLEAPFYPQTHTHTLSPPFRSFDPRPIRQHTHAHTLPALSPGLGPKLFESATKGAVLMYAKEAIKDASLAAGSSPFVAGLVGGAGGGVAQVCVFLSLSLSPPPPSSCLSLYLCVCVCVWVSLYGAWR